ncbi:hypothetical protein BKH41_00100 [Helicobacter sp. 12S02232-10]|uniref:hypothetical protein n=1 Tax=Helicobacter sp. 12S02232-10 TaxID=1476197 RepID=UPI000BA50A36|nr:hypothetical protein [Helicobacter sp. 12S02232-10]PAF49749.1 hypothetical protein BKH41_00100 [Helicobacter sp. 12S02232-10]
MNKFFYLFIFATLVFSKAPVWSFDQNVVLKKDQFYKGMVYKNYVQKPLFLRWTLYKNFGLVVHLNYDKFPYQFILYKDYQRDTFKLELFGNDPVGKVSYLYVSFRDFNQKENTASLWLGISGDAQFLKQ